MAFYTKNIMLDFFYKLVTPYGKASIFDFILNKAIEKFVNIIYPIYCQFRPCDIGVSQNKNCPQIIVSLTSFPARINKVWLCIETILRQSNKPDKIILWLATSQFENKMKLPKKLLKLQDRGLEIRFCDDLKSYKKIFFAAKEFYKEIIITADDDAFYPEDWIKRLLVKSFSHPNCVCCYRAHRIVLDNNKKPIPYKYWDGLANGITGPSYYLLPTGVGGVLYPPYTFDKINGNFEIIKTLCYTTDDIWLKAISLLKKIKVIKVDEYSKEWFGISNTQQHNLTKDNIGNNINDIALNNLINYYNIDFASYEDNQ